MKIDYDELMVKIWEAMDHYVPEKHSQDAVNDMLDVLSDHGYDIENLRNVNSELDEAIYYYDDEELELLDDMDDY